MGPARQGARAPPVAACQGERLAAENRYPLAADLVAAVKGDRADHAAIPKKSFAVTLHPVASAIFSITFGSGMRPLTYRRTDSWLTPIVSAN